MVLEVIYIVRHGYRMNWVVDPTTGVYRTTTRTPTGIPSDPELASYGVGQATQLGDKIATLDPPVDVVYSSPFYRCLQTLKPGVEKLVEQGRLSDKGDVRIERGVGEFFGTARFEHPAPAPVGELQKHFPNMISSSYRSAIIPSSTGETLTELHNRYAYALHRIIETLDKDPRKPRAVLLCSHAAGLICMGRALTGKMPDDWTENDFNCGTCALSKFVRRRGARASKLYEVSQWDEAKPATIPEIDWTNEKGVMGGWDCEVNGDCSFLENGEERTWSFTGDESFLDAPLPSNTTSSASSSKSSGSKKFDYESHDEGDSSISKPLPQSSSSSSSSSSPPSASTRSSSTKTKL